MITARDMTAAELAALLHFHAEAGVEWLVEDAPVDRQAAFSAEKQARQRPAAAAAPGTAPAPERRRPEAPQPAPRPAAAIAIPDEHAVTEARFAAESARTLDELRTAVEAFGGCNLKTSARSTVFAAGDPAAGVMVIGPMPSADDDREGAAFSGKAGFLLDRMLAAIGLSRETVLLSTVIPWRPPGDRPPSAPEAAICRPFVERQIELAEPKAVLLLGNFTARFFFGGTGTIHALRGEWREIACGSHAVPAIATLHPQELLTAPASKALAWADLQAFRARLGG
ncbi:DNA polymerase [Ciceribacter lividus]|uniref:Type-4 uracil-DNA glycosylase n=1 Tax=Ciceribacter lividus TaxID=1197950 RepID=A0A6I7HRC6_9HYPH|nr:uracil-DNA glycosylase [Ciceribacter lividus]RCW27536.1 DNA polymerase [Ciceribacter lividus]